ADAEPALDELLPVARLAPRAVVFHAADVRWTDACGENKGLNAPSDRIVGKGRHARGVETETALEAARDVVLAATLPHAKAARGVNPRFARIEAQHHLAERHEIPPAALLGRHLQRHRSPQ